MKSAPLEARRSFRQAQLDLQAVRVLRTGALFAAACFHAQQAAEKALKAVLYSQGERIVVGHSVTDLTTRCAAVNPAFGNLASDARLLDQFSIPTWYPNGLPAPAVPGDVYTDAEVQLAYDAAERVYQKAESFLCQHTTALD